MDSSLQNVCRCHAEQREEGCYAVGEGDAPLAPEEAGVQFNRHLKFKAWVKNAFRRAPNMATVKAWVKAWVKTVQNVF